MGGAFLVPFIKHNDANYALMSSNMHRQQVVPLSRFEKCIIGTGLKRHMTRDLEVTAIRQVFDPTVFYCHTK